MTNDLNIRTMSMAGEIQRIIATVPEEEWAAIAKLSEADQTAAIERIVAGATLTEAAARAIAGRNVEPALSRTADALALFADTGRIDREACSDGGLLDQMIDARPADEDELAALKRYMRQRADDEGRRAIMLRVDGTMGEDVIGKGSCRWFPGAGA